MTHPPHQSTSATSTAAAEAVKGKAPGRRETALLWFDDWSARDGLTDHDLATFMNIPLHSAVPIRNDLVKRGLVRDSGRTRPSPYRRPCTVWIRCGEGQQMELL